MEEDRAWNKTVFPECGKGKQFADNQRKDTENNRRADWISLHVTLQSQPCEDNLCNVQHEF